MSKKFVYSVFIVFGLFLREATLQKGCPISKAILPCRCLMRGEEYQIWCTHSDMPSVLDGLRATAKYIQEPIDEVILENNYLPALPGRIFFPLKILRLMLRHNGLERVSNDWLGGLETTLMELFIVEPKLRTIPDDSLLQLISLQAITIQAELMKRLPLFSGLPKLRYLQVELTSLLELSPLNFKDNPSLEKVHIGNCPRLTRLEANLLRDLPSLRLLNVSYSGITWMHPRAITRLPVLKELILVGNRISDAGMVGRASRELPQLEVLRLDENYIDKLGEAAFVDLPALRSLHLSNNRITELHHGAFHRVPSLRNLNLNGNSLRRVHPESFLQESGSGLEELWLVNNEISHVADLRALLDTLPRLVFLDMSYNHLEAIPFGSLRGHPTLEHLNLDHNNIHLIDTEAFVAMPALRELRLKNNSLSNTLRPPLWNLPELKGLDISGNFLRRLEPNFLSELPSLRKIDLSRNELTFIDPAAFTLNPSLEHINISFNDLATLHPATFRHLLGLYELDISNNMLMEFVPGLPRGIEYLHLKNNDITFIPPPPTSDLDLPSLRMLDLTRNKIEVVLKGSFKTLPQLRRLYLGKNFFKKLDEGSLKGLGRLETLDVRENGINQLSPNAFKDQTELRELNLGDNRLDLLASELFNYTLHLKKLNLTKNMIAEILPGTLDNNKELQMIDLSNNKLTRLSSTFMGLKNLRVLELTHNRLNFMDPEILGSLPSLRILKLSFNYIRELKENGFNKLQHLASLDLDENELEVIEPNAIKSLPILRRIRLSRNKIKEIPNMAMVNLPSLQVVELQENELISIAPGAFAGVPHLLMLNLSYNQIRNFEEAGLRGAKSLELLDISNNIITSVASPSLEKMEWLVELRMDSNKICGVQGSPFYNMPRLRVLSMRDNRMMSFPERVLERIRSNIAVLDIDGNPLACSCNMLWLQVWLQGSSLMGPRCADGTLLRELDLPRQDCPEEERNVEIVAPGCESELLSAPGVYGTSQVFSQWMNLKALNDSNSRNSIAPSPEESEYFYDEYVDYPYNDTMGKLHNTSTEKVPLSTRSPHLTPGDTPTIYASPKNKNNQKDKTIPKEINDSPSSSGFTFFGLPLPKLSSLLGSGVPGTRRDDKIIPSTIKMDDRVAIVNRVSSNPNGNPRMFNVPPNFPKLETGGFVPILPGSGGFTPILNPLTHQALQETTISPLKNVYTVTKDASTVESMNVLVKTTTQKPEKSSTQMTTSTIPTNVLKLPSNTTSNLPRKDKDATIAASLDVTTKYNPSTGKTNGIPEIRKTYPDKVTSIGEKVLTDKIIKETPNKTEEQFVITSTEGYSETTRVPIEETTVFKFEPTTVFNPKEKNLKQDIIDFSRLNTENDNIKPIPQAAFLIPDGQQPTKKMATITKVPSPNLAPTSLHKKPEYDATQPMAHNREPNKIIPSKQLNTEETVPIGNSDISWYYETYNTSKLDSFRAISSASGIYETQNLFFNICIILIFKQCFS